MNYIQLMFSLMVTSIIIVGSLINIFELYLPTFIRQTFRYGKFAYTGKRSKLVLEVPKSTFKQFYKFAIVVFTFIWYMVTIVYFFEARVPKWFDIILNITCGQNRIAYTPVIKVYVAVVLLTLQVYRRFYDTHFVSIFGRNSRMNFSQYIIGMIYYPAVALGILCEAPKFASTTILVEANETGTLNIWDIGAILLFLWAWYHQHVTTVILANLRKDKKGAVVTDSHNIPEGDWFHYLSCPHQTAEILMYLALTVLLWNNITWGFILMWVLSCQIETILLSHWWYQETFDKFPKNRKALIPFLY